MVEPSDYDVHRFMAGVGQAVMGHRMRQKGAARGFARVRGPGAHVSLVSIKTDRPIAAQIEIDFVVIPPGEWEEGAQHARE